MDETVVGEVLGMVGCGEGGRRTGGDGGQCAAGAYRLRGGCTGSTSGWDTTSGEPVRERGLWRGGEA